MKIVENYSDIVIHTWDGYGITKDRKYVGHTNAKEMEEKWKKIAPKSSLCEYFGTPIRKSADEDNYEKPVERILK